MSHTVLTNLKVAPALAKSIGQTLSYQGRILEALSAPVN